jgi:hypothetical protein
MKRKEKVVYLKTNKKVGITHNGRAVSSSAVSPMVVVVRSSGRDDRPRREFFSSARYFSRGKLFKYAHVSAEMSIEDPPRMEISDEI